MPLLLPELLCPAGNEAALHAAVDSGADAVYLGCKAFGARASAVNFDDETLSRAVCYAHLHHTRVYVTVNTLVKPDELAAVRGALESIAQCGADAVIVQDLGVAAMVASDFPSLRLHASTQMALCDAAGVAAAHALGFDRVVLARECRLSDIREACASGVEIEVFVHGALCTAVSGRCLMSSMSGGRSGNRGRCAQPCRQLFRLGGQSGPLLSLRDLCLLDDLPALCEAGVASLKIEGRLKSPEYVAVVTDVYRRALDRIAAGAFEPGVSLEKEKLLQIYNRGGFTRGHAMGAEDAALVTPEKVNHEGLPMGHIVSVSRDLAKLKLIRALHDGDTLQLRGQTEADMRYSGLEAQPGETATLRLRPGLHASVGTEVYRLSDAAQLDAARAHAPAPIPVRMIGSFSLNQPTRLSITDGSVAVTVTGSVTEAARSRASTVDDAVRQLEKLGGTPFVCAEARAEVDDNVFLPVSSLNALRREAVQALEDARIQAFRLPSRQPLKPLAQPHPAYGGIGPDTLAVVFSEPAWAEPLQSAGANLLFFAPHNLTPTAFRSALDALPEGTWLHLPPQLHQEDWAAVLPAIEACRSRLGGVAAQSLSQLCLPVDLPVIAGEGVPVTNALGVALMKQLGASAFTLWPEWTGGEQRRLAPFALPCLLKVYGRETLMLLNHCPRRVRLGLDDQRKDCRICRTPEMVCGERNALLSDRKDYRFPLSRTRFLRGCEIEVLGALPTDLRACDADRRALGAGMLLHFTTETAEEQLALTAQFAAFSRGEPISSAAASTSGHWLRGVE